MNTRPSTEHEWTVHALNIHGTFFERWCAHIFREHSQWQIRSTNYPVRYPPAINLPSRETAVDVWADRLIGETLLTFVIECKKNNPEFVNWILFGGSRCRYVQVTELMTFPEDGRWSCKIGASSIPHDGFVADDARETRGNYAQHARGDKTKTSNAAVSDATYQLAIGTQAIAWEEHVRARQAGYNRQPREWLRQVVVPVVVTSARLFRATFDAQCVDARTGEVAFANVELSETPFAVYEYPVPRHLHDPDTHIEHMLEQQQIEDATRLHAIVVTSSHLRDFLDSEFVSNLARVAAAA